MFEEQCLPPAVHPRNSALTSLENVYRNSSEMGSKCNFLPTSTRPIKKHHVTLRLERATNKSQNCILWVLTILMILCGLSAVVLLGCGITGIFDDPLNNQVLERKLYRMLEKIVLKNSTFND